MIEQHRSYYPFAFFANAHLPVLKLAAPYFDKLIILDLIGASWTTLGAHSTTPGRP